MEDPQIMAVRVVLQGKELRTIRLDPEITYIGRMAENHIVIDDPKVSRSHARILRINNRWMIEDQESENGVFLNGKMVKMHAVGLGDKISIGPCILEIIPAEKSAAPVAREAQLMESEDEEWRMDQTISSISSQHLEALRAKQEPASKEEPSFPKVSLTFTLGNTTLNRTLVFERGRKRDANDKEGSTIEVRIKYGRWILERKSPL